MARSKYKSATNLDQLRQDIANVCKELGIPDPARFHAYIMGGIDPRNIPAQVIQMIRKIQLDYLDGERETDMPDEYEWREICNGAFESIYDHAPIDFETARKASAELLKYLHRNQIEMKAAVETTTKRDLAPITKQEISDFLDVFEARY